MPDTSRRKIASSNAVVVTLNTLKTYGDKNLARGEVFELKGLRNDGLLLAHGYVARMSVGDEALLCSFNCGRAFAYENVLSDHYRDVHRDGGKEANALEKSPPVLPSDEEMFGPPGKRFELGSPAQPAVAMGPAEE